VTSNHFMHRKCKSRKSCIPHRWPGPAVTKLPILLSIQLSPSQHDAPEKYRNTTISLVLLRLSFSLSLSISLSLSLSLSPSLSVSTSNCSSRKHHIVSSFGGIVVMCTKKETARLSGHNFKRTHRSPLHQSDDSNDLRPWSNPPLF